MLFAPLVLAGLAAATVSPIRRGQYDVPQSCVVTCPHNTNEVVAACLAFLGKGDESQKAVCEEMCLPQIKPAVMDCHACVKKVNEEIGGIFQFGYDTVCTDGSTETKVEEALPSEAPAASPTDEDDAPADASSTDPAPSLTASASPTANATETEKENNGGSTAVIAPAVMVLGLVAAMI